MSCSFFFLSFFFTIFKDETLSVIRDRARFHLVRSSTRIVSLRVLFRVAFNPCYHAASRIVGRKSIRLLLGVYISLNNAAGLIRWCTSFLKFRRGNCCSGSTRSLFSRFAGEKSTSRRVCVCLVRPVAIATWFHGSDLFNRALPIACTGANSWNGLGLIAYDVHRRDASPQKEFVMRVANGDHLIIPAWYGSLLPPRDQSFWLGVLADSFSIRTAVRSFAKRYLSCQSR